MKLGTVLKNTSVYKDHPMYLSIYIGKSKNRVKVIYLYPNIGIKCAYYLASDIGIDKPIIPIGTIDLVKILKKELQVYG